MEKKMEGTGRSDKTKFTPFATETTNPFLAKPL